MRAFPKPLAWIIALVAVLGLSLWWLARPRALSAPVPGSPSRIVSLSPAITETLFAIGVGPRVAGVSDYCDYPAAARQRPKLGTALTPNFERIARLQPDLIVSDQSVASDKTRLDALGPTLRLPWLSLADIVSSTRRLGRYAGAEARADELARRLEQRLGRPAPADGPRVLLVLSAESTGIDPVWFIRRNSLHGAALRAAGARNAVAEDVLTMPRLSLERVIALDPDAIVLLVGDSDGRSALAAWRKVDVLSAVKRDRIAVLPGGEAFSDGPRILDFADRLSRTLAALPVNR